MGKRAKHRGLLIVAVMAGCGPVAEQPSVQINLAAEAAVEGFVAAVLLGDQDEDADEGARLERIGCPGGESTEHLSCDGAGLVIEPAPETIHVTIKARGFAFVSRTIETATLARTAGRHAIAIELDQLPPFERNDDFATGFDADDEAIFDAMAEKVDTELGPARVVKFYIADLASETPRVYFQNTPSHPLHHPFARSVLGVAGSLEAFEAATYRGEQREAMAGTLVQYLSIRAPSSFLGEEASAPIAVTFFPSDDLTPPQAAQAQRLIEQRIGFSPLVRGDRRVMYLPAGTAQETQLQAATDLFARLDAPWVVRRELAGGARLQVLNPGLAFGRLRRLSPEQLQRTVVSFGDVLVLTRLPNSLPIVGGTITEELQAPLAHVNVAARARGTPNIALLGAGSDPRVAGLLGKLVRFEFARGSFSLREASATEVEAFLASRHAEPLVPTFDVERDDLPGFDEIGFADAISVGAKAANLAELSQLLGDRAPRGFAIPFGHYDRLMQTAEVTPARCDAARADCQDEGRPAEICQRAHALCLPPGGQPERLWAHADRLLADPQFKVETELREAALDALRHHIRHVPVDPAFAAKLDQRVVEVFGAAKVRLRSSTNAEDLPSFSGAGLYTSVSAYGSGADKRASDQVRKVWASAWSFPAFEERSFWNIDHRSVRMGVAVNRAFSDEVANGVLITQNIADPTVAGMYVNVQKGEVPVTNPEGGALPEIFSIIPAPPAGIQVARLRYSSLSPGEPLLTDAEIGALFGAAAAVQQHFAPLYGEDPNRLALDLEFKFHGPQRGLFIKQVRPYLQAGEPQ